jgi:hypothetical protein
MAVLAVGMVPNAAPTHRSVRHSIDSVHRTRFREGVIGAGTVLRQYVWQHPCKRHGPPPRSAYDRK